MVTKGAKPRSCWHLQDIAVGGRLADLHNLEVAGIAAAVAHMQHAAALAGLEVVVRMAGAVAEGTAHAAV